MTATDFDLMGPKGSKEIAFSANASAKTIAAAVNDLASSTGVTATATSFVKLSSVSAAAATTMTLNGGGTATAISFTLSATSDLTAMKDAINAVAGSTGVTAAFDAGSKAALILNDADGDNISLTNFTQGTATMTVQAMKADGSTMSATAADVITSGGTDSTIVTGSFSLTADAAFSVQDQETGDTDVSSLVGYFNTAATKSSTLSAVSAIDIGTTTGARTAMNAIDGALRMVSAQRSDLGSVSNRLDSTVSNLTNISTNLSAGKGRIEDADFAAETTNLAKTQILQQASTAMLAQANSSKQNVLSLLQG
jgi:flagellin